MPLVFGGCIFYVLLLLHKTSFLDSRMPPKRRKLDRDSSQDQQEVLASSFNHVLSGIKVFILPAGIQKVRLNLFKANVKNLGGCVEENVTHNTTHIIVDDAMTPERACKIMKVDALPQGKVIIKSAWLSECFDQKVIVDVDPFLLDTPKPKNIKHDPYVVAVNKGHGKEQYKAFEEQPMTSLLLPKTGVPYTNTFTHKSIIKNSDEDADSDYFPSDSEASDGTLTNSTDTTPNTTPEKKLPIGKWICTQSSKVASVNANEHITSKLEEMVKNYESTNDKWRAFGYQKAIAALKKHPKQITSWEEARALPCIGSKLADKIWEIVQSGELRKLNEFQSNEQLHVLKLFTDVWGAGPHTALKWYQQGFKTLEDLQTKANLTSQQKIGVRLYNDLLDRMPREEARDIENIVREAAEAMQPGVIAQACGSFRRGKPTCGDVDILITHPDGHSHKGIFAKLIQKLKDIDFLTDDLVSVEDSGNQKKYLGVCKLPGPNRKHRRLDIIVVPYDEYGCALVYFTGSAHFNRSLRHLCKKMGMSLNEHALRTGVVRKGAEKIFEGIVIPTPTEESVFNTLDVPFRPPEERDH